MFGDEKRAKPNPRIIRYIVIKSIEVVLFMNDKTSNPKLVNPIPIEAIIPGCILSESLPARGERIVIVTGWAMSMSPALCGENPFKY